jgi:hypothetical protein
METDLSQLRCLMKDLKDEAFRTVQAIYKQNVYLVRFKKAYESHMKHCKCTKLRNIRRR